MPAARAKPSLPLKLLLAAILAVLAGFASATPAAAQDGASSQGPTAAGWPQIVERARGQTVYFNAWGGDETVNAYIAWAGERVAEDYGITLRHVKLNDTADAIARIDQSNPVLPSSKTNRPNFLDRVKRLALGE